jgi:two-component system, cell cycle sensor histidine kinase and response regulator CckA
MITMSEKGKGRLPDETGCECRGGGSKSPRRRILVMDDEPMLRNLIGQMLGRLGYEVEVSGCGEETLKKYLEALETGRPFDAVILDLTVQGGMGGEETIGALREVNRRIRAIVSSGHAGDPVMSDYGRWGFCARIFKPYRMRDLEWTLEEIFSEA